MKIAVLGAGVSGLTAARLLHDQNNRVTVYEKMEKIGGLTKSRICDGFVYDPHGAHVFNSKYEEIKKWIFSLLPEDNWQFTVRNAKIFFDGEYISYPFELSLCELPTQKAIECACDFIQSGVGPEPATYKEWLVWKFGQSIADYYMIPYNSKIWAYPLEKMETKWVSGKMPLPEKIEVLRSLVEKDNTERKMPHSTFYYPLHGGIESMIHAISDPLNIITNHPIKKIEKKNDGWYIDDDGPFDKVISTIPLPNLARVMELPEDIIEAINGLKYNSLTTVLIECDPTDISWLYIPSSKYRSHRIGYQCSLTPYAAPNGTGCGAIEIIGPRFEINPDEIVKTVPEQLRPKQVLDYEFTEYAYVIHDLYYRENIKIIMDYFNKFDDFFTLGRWGRWNYNNMDICMKDAFDLIHQKFE